MKIKKGFTLIELMIVVMVIGILLVIIIPRVGTMIDRSRERSCAKNLKNIQAAVTMYCVRPGPEGDLYPDSDEKFEAILKQYFPQGIPVATLRRGASNADSNRVRVGVGTECINNDGGWLLVIGEASSERGRVFINSQEKDLDNEYYSSYPSW